MARLAFVVVGAELWSRLRGIQSWIRYGGIRSDQTRRLPSVADDVRRTGATMAKKSRKKKARKKNAANHGKRPNS
jgi:hypothetical protein